MGYKAMERACFFWPLPCHLSKSYVPFSKVEAERTWDSCLHLTSFYKMMVGAVSAVHNRSQGSELVLEYVEGGSGQWVDTIIVGLFCYWEGSEDDGKAEGGFIYFLNWDKTGKCVGRWNRTWESKCLCHMRSFLETLEDSIPGFLG